MKQEILDRLNEIIIEEKGVRVTMDSKFSDAELDSLGTVITIATLEGDYPIFKDVPIDADALSTMNFETLTIRELVRQCILSKQSTSPEASSKINK
jgi:acyl carrier protein